MHLRLLRILSITAVCVYALFPLQVEANLSSLEEAAAGKHKKAAIVIDDFGSDMAGTKEMFELPITFTAAIIPFQSTTKRDAEWAHQSGNEVIVHLPMEPLGRKNRSWLGTGAITSDLDDEEIRRRVNAAVDNVPYAVGINNHMGSKITADERIMRIVLEVCRERGMFYLDSKTNYRSVTGKLAKEMGVHFVENQMFLDDVHTVRHITRQMNRMKDYLSVHEQCIAIGHVGRRGGKRTAEAIKGSTDRMKDNVDFVPVSQMLPHSPVPPIPSWHQHASIAR